MLRVSILCVLRLRLRLHLLLVAAAAAELETVRASSGDRNEKGAKQLYQVSAVPIIL